jgi:hypothetical protein
LKALQITIKKEKGRWTLIATNFEIILNKDEKKLQE